MANRNIVEFIWDDNIQAYQLRFPYDKNMVELLKKVVSANERDYDPPTRTWFIAEKYYDGLIILLQQMFESKGVKVFTFPRSKAEQSAVNTTVPDTNKQLSLLEEFLQKAAVPVEKPFKEMSLGEATKVYRKLALFYHPDRKPEYAPIMSTINEAWANLKGVYFK